MTLTEIAIAIKKTVPVTLLTALLFVDFRVVGTTVSLNYLFLLKNKMESFYIPSIGSCGMGLKSIFKILSKEEENLEKVAVKPRRLQVCRAWTCWLS